MTSAISLTIQALIGGSPAGTGTAGTRVYPDPVPEKTALPAIAVSLVAEDEDRLLGGMSQYPMAIVQIDCLAADVKTAIELGESVKTRLRDTLTIYGSYNADFQKSGPDFTDASDEQDIFRRVVTYAVRWRATS